MPTSVHHASTSRAFHSFQNKKRHHIASHRVSSKDRRLTSYQKNDHRSCTCSRSATCTTNTPIQSCNTSIHYRSRSNTNRSCSSLRRRKQSHSSVSQPLQSKYLFDTVIQSQSIERTVIRRTGVRVGSTRGGVAVSLAVRSASHAAFCRSYGARACADRSIGRVPGCVERAGSDVSFGRLNPNMTVHNSSC